jgi:hypothetical protein
MQMQSVVVTPPSRTHFPGLLQNEGPDAGGLKPLSQQQDPLAPPRQQQPPQRPRTTSLPPNIQAQLGAVGKRTPAIEPVKLSMSKSALINLIAEENEIPRKTADGVYKTLENVLLESAHPRGLGEFTLPGLLKVNLRKAPARKAGTLVRNPRRGRVALIGLTLAGFAGGGLTVGTEGQCHGEASTKVAAFDARNGQRRSKNHWRRRANGAGHAT